MSEAKTQKKILDYLKDLGCWTVKTIVSNKKGVPDILACHPTGRFIAVEVKAEGGRASRLQLEQLEQLRALGAVTVVAYSIGDVMSALESCGLESRTTRLPRSSTGKLSLK